MYPCREQIMLQPFFLVPPAGSGVAETDETPPPGGHEDGRQGSSRKQRFGLAELPPNVYKWIQVSELYFEGSKLSVVDKIYLYNLNTETKPVHSGKNQIMLSLVDVDDYRIVQVYRMFSYNKDYK